MTFQVTILGSNSATPANGRHPTAQVLTLENQSYLIDCGEGTQMRLSEFNVKRGKINHIFISHMHGDHVLGLMGLLNTYSLNGRKRAMHLFGPPELEEFVRTQERLTHSHFAYELIFHPVDQEVDRKSVV